MTASSFAGASADDALVYGQPQGNLAVSLSVASTYYRTAYPENHTIPDMLGGSSIGPHVVLMYTIRNLGHTAVLVRDVYPFSDVIFVKDASGRSIGCGDRPRPLYRDFRKHRISPKPPFASGGANLNPYWDSGGSIIEPGQTRNVSPVGAEMTCFRLIAGQTYTVWGVAEVRGHWEPGGEEIHINLVSNTIRVTAPFAPSETSPC